MVGRCNTGCLAHLSRTLGSARPLEAENYTPFFWGAGAHLAVLLCSNRGGTSDLGTLRARADKTVLCWMASAKLNES